MPPLTAEERQAETERFIALGYAPDYAAWCAGWAAPDHPANQTRFAYMAMLNDWAVAS